MRTEDEQNNAAARSRWYKMLNWSVHIDLAERYLLSIAQKAKDEQFFETLYVRRDDANRQISLFAGQHPIGTAAVRNDAHGREVERTLAEHGAALVISQSAEGSVAIILYPYGSEKAKRVQDHIVWSVFDNPTEITERLLAKVIKDFFCYIRVSSVLFSESWIDRARILYLEVKGKKYVGNGGFAGILFSRWFLPFLGAAGSVASIYELFHSTATNNGH